MFQYYIPKQKFTSLFLGLLLTGMAGYSQKIKSTQPVWWFGESAAANFNTYRGTTQVLNNSVTLPAAFHKGDGVKPYASLLAEYRPNRVWGGMLNVAYDNRGGKFDQVMAPCDCPANLSTIISYVTVEPSLRFAPFGSKFYLFGGPTISFNVTKAFTYTQQKQIDKRGAWSDINKTVFSAQAGAGIDIPLSASNSVTQMRLSPFVSFLTDFGHDPRKVESWSVYTVRAGMALKFGKKKVTEKIKPAEEISAVAPIEKDVQFTVRAPKVVPLNRQVKETFPIRNSVFFNLGSTDIPGRYVLLNTAQAGLFKEEQLQEGQPNNLNNGRSARQLAVYYNILNIVGDRMRSNPRSTISLSGASDKNPVEGKMLAGNIKNYLVTVFGINASRITTEGRDKPLVPSEQPGATTDIALLKAGDRRVDIVSTSPELLMQVGGSSSPFLKPVQIKAVQPDPLDSHVLLNVEGANVSLKSWKVDITDEKGAVQHYGPYTQEQASIAGKTILGTNSQGNYKVLMSSETKSGKAITKQSSVSLMKANDTNQEGLRYSILFDFDKSKSIASYETFLSDVVTPLIPAASTVIIHGHTDIIGDEKYNHILSNERAKSAQDIISQALSTAGKKGVTFETYGFGEDANMSPFENNFPEERFYNRSVIIDIVLGQ